MAPRVPRTAIAHDAATAELFDDFSESHVEIAREEVNSVTTDLVGQSIPELCQGSRPFEFHGSVMPMRSCHHNFFSDMADVLFEQHLAHQYSGSRLLRVPFLRIVVVVVDFVL